MPYCIEPLTSAHDRSTFACGQETLDRYLKTQAGQDLRRNVAVTFVLVETGERLVLGYYTLSSYGIVTRDLPPELSRKLPRYEQIPATLLGRLAIDSRRRGQHLGEFLLMNALERAYEQSTRIASYALVVDAIDEAARRFYLHYNFLPFPEHLNRLFLPMGTIAQLFP